MNSYHDWLEKWDRASTLARLIADAALSGQEPFAPWAAEYQQLRAELRPKAKCPTLGQAA